MPNVSRFKRRNSDRSGFKHYEIDLIRDKGFLVAGNEFDTPPPSELPLGGEGDLSGDPRSSSDFTISNVNTAVPDKPTYYITAAGGISADLSRAWMNVTGSNAAVTITSNPRISQGKESDILTLFCTDSQITIQNGNSVATVGSVPVVLTSGSYVTFIYNTSNTAWNETSRGRV